jgi:two-component sensor histidine kinase/PAS domain-containing protein
MSTQDKKTILLVEDEAIIALAQKTLLERQGYTVLLARSGEEAVTLADSGRELHLILMDINLGAGMDGTQAAEIILSRHEIPLAFLSSHTEREVVDKTEGITSYGYIVKNSGETVLLASIKMAFRLFEARAELRDREEHYRSLFEHDVGAVWVEDFSGFKRRLDELRRAGHTDFRAWLSAHPEELLSLAELIIIVDLNKEALRSVGLQERGNRSMTLREFLDDQAKDFFADELCVLAEGGRSFEREISYTGPGGEPLHCLLNVELISGYERDLGRVHVVIRDLSGLRRAEKALEAQARLQSLLVELSATYINLPPEAVDDAVQYSLAQMAQCVGADRAYIFDYDFERGLAGNSHEWCAPGIEPQKDRLQDLPLSLIDEGIREHTAGKAHYLEAVQALPEGAFRALLEGQGIRSLLTVPLMRGGECVGCVGFDSVKRHSAFSENERVLLTVFAQMLASVEQRRRSLAELERDRAELKAVYNATPVMICVLDDSQRVLYANPAFSAFTGMPEEQLRHGRACGVFGCINAHDDPRGCGYGQSCPSCALNGALQDTIRTGAMHQELEYRTVFMHGDSRREITLLASTAAIDDGPKRRALLCLQDISERAHAEERIKSLLREKELLLLETHHRVKNNMMTIRSLLSLQARMREDRDASEVLSEAADRVQGMMELYNLLYLPGAGTSQALAEFLPPLIDKMLAIYPASKRVTKELIIPDLTLPYARLSSLGIIVNELIANSMKHAFKDGAAGRIRLAVEDEAGSVRLRYSDDGPGPPSRQDLDNASGLGMRLIRALSEELGGTVALERDGSWSFTLSFPL